MNPQKNKQRQLEIKNLLSRYKTQLMAIEGVRDIGVGFKFENNRITNELAIIVEMKKEPKADSDTALLPQQIEGVAVSVIESPVPEFFYYQGEEIHPEIKKIAQARNQFYEELIGGIRIKNAKLKGYGGTLGSIVYDRNNGEAFGLTSHHVLIPPRRLAFWRKAPIIQPNKRGHLKMRIGEVKLSRNSALDCVRFKLNHRRKINTENNFLGINGKIKGIETEMICGTKVMKSGARTGVTYGIIVCESVCNDGFIIYPDEDYDLIDGELSLAGDSGAVWLVNDGSMKAIGLHCLGNKRKHIDIEFSMALSIEKVLDHLKLRF